MADLTKDRLADTYSVARASRYSSPEAGGDALPLPFGDLTTPARSSAGVYYCPKIDTGGAGTYCVAGGRIEGSATLFDDEGEIDPGDYTLNTANDFQGKGVISTAAFSVAPVGIVSAICKGMADDGGALIENPVRVIEKLMTSFWGFSDQDIDQGALGLAAERAEALGYEAAGVIEHDHSPAEMLTDILGDFLGRFEVNAYGRLRVFLEGEETVSVYPVKDLPALEAAEVEAETRRDSVINRVPVLYAKNYLDGRHLLHDEGEETADAASQWLYGVRTPPEGRLDLDWVRKAAVARAVQARIVERFRTPARGVTVRDGTFRALEAEPGDYVAFSVPWMRTEYLEPLMNQIGEVISFGPDLREQTLALRLRDTGFYRTRSEKLDGSKTLDGSWLLGAARDLAAHA